MQLIKYLGANLIKIEKTINNFILVYCHCLLHVVSSSFTGT